MAMTVFVSHNKLDADVARGEALFLAAEGINVWFDEWSISAGDSIVEQISGGLKDCTHLIIIWSRHANTSNWVRRELSGAIARAISDGSPRIIPVVVDDTPLPALIADLAYLRWKGGSELDRREIIESVVGVSPSATFIRAIVKKYRELVTDQLDPIGFRACPECGNEELERGSAIDDVHGDYYIWVKCKECGWETGDTW